MTILAGVLSGYFPPSDGFTSAPEAISREIHKKKIFIIGAISLYGTIAI